MPWHLSLPNSAANASKRTSTSSCWRLDHAAAKAGRAMMCTSRCKNSSRRRRNVSRIKRRTRLRAWAWRRIFFGRDTPSRPLPESEKAITKKSVNTRFLSENWKSAFFKSRADRGKRWSGESDTAIGRILDSGMGKGCKETLRPTSNLTSSRF